MKWAIMLLLVMVVLLCGCPGPSEKANPYLTAHVVINQASLALPIAEGIFNQWLYRQPELDNASVKRTVQGFYRVMTALRHSVKLAHDGVDIAEQMKEDPDVNKLLRLSDVAWKGLRDFLGELLAGGSSEIVVSIIEETEPEGAEPEEIEVRILSMPISNNPMTALPKSLLPDGRLTRN